MDPAFRLRLRSELLTAHAEMTAHRRSWWRLGNLIGRRVVVVVPAALTAALIAAIALVGLQVSGTNAPRTASAQKLTAAMVRTAPTVTGWNFTVTHHYSNSAVSRGFAEQLGKNWRVYILTVQGRLTPYLYIGRQPHGVPEETSNSLTSASGQWLWEFAQLPAKLAEHQARVLPGTKTIGGHTAAGVQYAVQGQGGLRMTATAWVDVSSGRILSLERQVLRGGHVVEMDWARYQYQRGTR
jgi:hypothetical protein